MQETIGTTFSIPVESLQIGSGSCIMCQHATPDYWYKGEVKLDARKFHNVFSSESSTATFYVRLGVCAACMGEQKEFEKKCTIWFEQCKKWNAQKEAKYQEFLRQFVTEEFPRWERNTRQVLPYSLLVLVGAVVAYWTGHWIVGSLLLVVAGLLGAGIVEQLVGDKEKRFERAVANVGTSPHFAQQQEKFRKQAEQEIGPEPRGPDGQSLSERVEMMIAERWKNILKAQPITLHTIAQDAKLDLYVDGDSLSKAMALDKWKRI